ncbi:alpha/beta hydrolase [Amycolatopsis rubida]|uniref:Alpha/beta hydrolase n=1 Tax=Amycolatopsis rubida TaxID=112413 RepID=A0ABX0BKK0_9PSEU|nr:MULTISPECIES: alpha/beta hydrolase [Amycolatopsis]NEC54627.1 alpha/beta hydrolase [Amycolatopsis rubida]OAP23564.1 Carboxylesterase NlhH [Amycolatopsis sp. M39]
MSYPFDPEIAAAVPMLPEVDLADVAAARAGMAELIASMQGEFDETGVRTREDSVPGPEGAPDVPVRVYTPDRVATNALVFDIHGGGFALGDLEVDHAANVGLARDLGVVIVSVEYRLAPENPYPAGLEDCYAALEWSVKHANELGIDPEKTVLYGVSAGGGLAAALALLARDRGGPAIAFQFLAVPELDDRLETGSMRRFADTPIWHRGAAEASWDYYLGGPGKRGGSDVPVYAAPARAADLSGLPPAYVSVMEFDPLRDEGIAYAQSLLAAGVPTELHLFPGTFHGSGVLQHATVSRREAAERRAVLARVLGVEGS